MKNLKIIIHIFTCIKAKYIGLKRPSKIMISLALGIILFSNSLTAQSFSSGTKALNNFTAAQGWQVNTHFRTLADVDGNGIVDIVGFGDSQVLVALGDHSGKFGKAIGLSDQFTKAKKWKTDKHFRCVDDVNGDGSADIVGFHDDGVYVQLYDRSKKRFGKYTATVKDLGTNQGWTVNNHPRYIADVNGDGKSDIIGFGDASVFAAIGDGNGNFAKLKSWTNEFTKSKGWNKTKPRMLLDLNGDGKADLLGIDENGVYVAYSNGNGFSPKKLATREFANGNSWSTNNNIRTVADFNNDGIGDLVGYGNDGIYIALGQLNGTFATAQRNALNDLTKKQGWNNEKHFRTAADINGDGYAELVGFGSSHVIIAINKASGNSTPPSSTPTPTSTPISSNQKAGLNNFVADISQFFTANASSKNNITLGVQDITLRPILEGLAKDHQELNTVIKNIPSFVLDELKLETCNAQFDAKNKYVKLTNKVSVGGLPFNSAMVIGRKDNGKLRILFGASLPGLQNVVKFVGKKISSKELAAIEQYFSFNTGLFFASDDFPEGFVTGIPIFKKYSAKQGMSVRGVATIKWNTIKKEVDTQTYNVLRTIFNEESSLELTATVKPNSPEAILEMAVNPNFSIPSPIAPHPKMITLNGLTMGINMSPTSTVLKALGDVTIHVVGSDNTKTDLKFGSGFTLKPINNSIGLLAYFEAVNGTDKSNGRGWENPFGLPGVAIEKLGVEADLEATIPWISGAVRGAASLGFTNRDFTLLKLSPKTVTPLKGDIALRMDVNSPQSNLMSVKFSSLKVGALLDAYPVVNIPNGHFKDGINAGLSNVELYFSPTAQTIANEKYPMGLKVKGNADIFGWNGALDVQVNPTDLNFKIFGTMNPLKAKIPGTSVQLFHLRGSNGGNAKLDVKAGLGISPSADASIKLDFLKIGNQSPLFSASGNLNFNLDSLRLAANASIFGLYNGKIRVAAGNYVDLEKANYAVSGSFNSPAELYQRLSEQLVENARKGVRDAQKLKANYNSKNVFDKAALDLYVELKKGENAAADAAAYLLTKGFVLSHISFKGNASPQGGSFTAHIKGSVSNQSFDERITISASTFEIQKLIEKTATALMNEFKTEGTKFINDLKDVAETTNTKVWDIASSVFKGGFTVPEYKVELDYKVEGSKQDEVSGKYSVPVYIILKDVNKREIGRFSSKDIWSSFNYNYEFPGSVKRTKEVKYIEVVNTNEKLILLDHLVLKLDGKNIFQYGQNDDKDVQIISSVDLPTSKKAFTIEVNKKHDYKIAFHYSKAGDTMLKAEVRDPSGEIVQTASKGYQKHLAGWIEFNTITTSRIIDKIKIYNEGKTTYVIDQVEIFQNGIKISDYGLRGQNNATLNGNFEYSIE